MLTNERLLKIAMRYDTAMSRAMLRALGVDVPHRIVHGVIVRADKVDESELRECMSQRYGVRL